MSLILRIEMIILAVAIAGRVFYSIYKKRLGVQYSIPWFLMALALLTVALFPAIVFWLCGVLAIETPVNLIYLLGILALLLLAFSQAKRISKQSEQIKSIIQTVSIEKYISEENK